MQISKVTNLTDSELNQIIHLHKTLLNQSFLNKLGTNFSKVFYQAVVKDKNNFFYLVKDTKQVVGFLLGTSNNQSFISRAFLLSPHIFIFELLKVLAWNPQVVSPLIFSVLKSKEKAVAELQFIAIDKNFQKQGLGTKLINHFKSDLKEKNINNFIVGTKSDDPTSNSFYKKNNYEFIYEKNGFGEKLNFYSTSF